MTRLGSLFPIRSTAPTLSSPHSPFAMAARTMQEEGIEVLLTDSPWAGGRAFAYENGAWVPADPTGIDGFYHRFPDHSRPNTWSDLLSRLPADAPLVNDPSVVNLCLDKAKAQECLEAAGIPMPPMAVGPTIAPALAKWRRGVLKPRFGSFGQGIRWLEPGETLPPYNNEWILQRAVPPPEKVAGVSIRSLVQRTPQGWVCCPLAVRVSKRDPIVNRARGAEVEPPSYLPHGVQRQITSLSIAAAEAIAAHRGGDACGEVGVDFVLDRDEQPWLIEVNGKPRGRLEVLAERFPHTFRTAHLEAICRPLRWVAHLAEAR